MPITIDDDALHEWARGNGYVHSTILEQIRRLVTGDAGPPLPVSYFKQPEDLTRPTITRKDIDTAFRSLVDFYTPRDVPATEAIKVGVSAGLALLTYFGASKLSDIKDVQFPEFMGLITLKDRYRTADDFIVNLQP